MPRTVLIVEDNALNLKLLKDVLEYHGYTVFTTRRGEPALELARQCKPDLILMDIQLPDISGIEATRRLKADEQTRSIPVIGLRRLPCPETSRKFARADVMPMFSSRSTSSSF